MRERQFPEHLASLFDNGKRTILLTSHRRENLEEMTSVFRAVKRIVNTHKDEVQVVFPMHKNPKVRKQAHTEIGHNNNIHLIEPLEYEQFVQAMSKSYLVITDSGGIQEEAPGLGKPVLVTRDTTERPEGVEAGTLKLVGTSEELIFRETLRLLVDEEEYNRMQRIRNPFGEGDTSDQIVDLIKREFSLNLTLSEKR